MKGAEVVFNYFYFSKHPLSKQLDFLDWSECYNLILNKAHF